MIPCNFLTFEFPVCIHLSSGSSISTSNPCMHSSLTSSHSYHLLCSSNLTADISDTPQSDSGYWIEGPTGEDIRSSWRGQPIHVLVVDALLHPRATNLPAHVQSAYIQSAMKVICTLVNNSYVFLVHESYFGQQITPWSSRYSKK